MGEDTSALFGAEVFFPLVKERSYESLRYQY